MCTSSPRGEGGRRRSRRLEQNDVAPLVGDLQRPGGDPGGVFNLATMLEFGRGVEKNEAEAARWYRQASDMGDPESMFRLARMLSEGRGVPKDVEEAVNWLRRVLAAPSATPRIKELAGKALSWLGEEP